LCSRTMRRVSASSGSSDGTRTRIQSGLRSTGCPACWPSPDGAACGCRGW
jgi:hypothetical protein